MRRLPDGRVVFETRADVPPVAMTLATTSWNRTGDWRSREPFFRDLTPPCSSACPLAKDVCDELRLLAQGRVREAGEVLLAANPFPAVTGRVCPHPCTAACNRGRMEGALDIPGLERTLGDALLAQHFELVRGPDAGARVAVVGAGPAGLTAAHYLALGGCDVTLFDRDERPGGLLRTGIPPYRLPRAVLDAEVERALGPGVRYAGGQALGVNLELAELAKAFDAVLLAVGLGAPRRLGVEGEDAEGVVDGLELLAALNAGGAAPGGERAVVVGGGSTAFDCARSLRRRGFEVTVAYRRGRGDMPAFAEEVREAAEEGVAVEDWLVPRDVGVVDGCARWIRFSRASPGEPDETGRARPVVVPGLDRTLPVDLVVVATGQGLDSSGFPPDWVKGGLLVPPGGEASADRVLAIGDCAGGGGTVAHAIGAGRRAAAALAARVGGTPPAVDLLAERGAGAAVVGFGQIRPAWHRPSAPRPRGSEDPALRRQDDREVRGGFGPEEAAAESARCLACGTCTACGVCYELCPDRAVVRGPPGGYAVDATRCKGCGVCAQECPRGAVELRERVGG